MDFTKLTSANSLLALRTSENKLTLGFIDGRGPEPHDLVSTDLASLISKEDSTPLIVYDADERRSKTSIKLSMRELRDEIRKRNLVVYPSYEAYKTAKENDSVAPLTRPKYIFVR